MRRLFVDQYGPTTLSFTLILVSVALFGVAVLRLVGSVAR